MSNKFQINKLCFCCKNTVTLLSFFTNISPPQRSAVSAPLSERWAKMARQLLQGAYHPVTTKDWGLADCSTKLSYRTNCTLLMQKLHSWPSKFQIIV